MITVNSPREIGIMKSESAWLLFALGSAVFGGATAILAKIGVEGIDSNLATFYRTLIVLAFIGVIVSARGDWSGIGTVTVRSWGFLALSGIATAASWLCYYRALQLAPASRVAPVDKLSLVVAIALGVSVLGEPLTARFLLGALLVVAGIFVIAWS
jgi:transporter family protein